MKKIDGWYVLDDTWVTDSKNTEEVILKVEFRVKFNKKGEVIAVSRNCSIPRPTCEGCAFEDWCNRLGNKILDRK